VSPTRINQVKGNYPLLALNLILIFVFSLGILFFLSATPLGILINVIERIVIAFLIAMIVVLLIHRKR